jgi:hypothetical protein
VLQRFEGGHFRCGRILEKNFAARRMHQAGDAFEERALAGTICTNDGNDLAGAYTERNAEECLEVAIERVNGIDFEERAVRHRRQFPYRFQLLAGYV